MRLGRLQRVRQQLLFLVVIFNQMFMGFDDGEEGKGWRRRVYGIKWGLI